MKYSGSLYVISDAERTKQFYKDIFKLRVIQDFKANFTLTGGLSFQTKESWKEFINKADNEIYFKGNNAEIYFETNHLDEFIALLESQTNIEYVHPLKTHDWGQRGIRIYDPDYHIIEVSESLKTLCQRLFNQGLNMQEISRKTMLSEKMVTRFLKK